MTMEKVTLENLRKARLGLRKKMPYLSAAIFALDFREKPEVGTLAVDKSYKLYYNPALEMEFEELVGCLYHEVSHLLRRHHKRGEGKDPKKANVAGDLEINDHVGGLVLPDWVLTPEKFGFPSGLLMEEYYELLEDMDESGDGGSGSDGESENSGDSGDDSGPGKVGAGECGSCAHGNGEDYEEPGGVSESRGELISRQVAKDILDHAKSRGDVPGGWVRWAEEKLKSKVDWRKELRAVVRREAARAGTDDYTFRKWNPRNESVGGILPRLRGSEINVGVVIDTSASITKKELSQLVAEADGILRNVSSGEMHVCICDAAAKVKRVRTLRKMPLEGGGGTDMRVGIEALLPHRPDIIVVLTDGETPWPDRPVGPKIVAALTEDRPVPEFVKRVIVEV